MYLPFLPFLLEKKLLSILSENLPSLSEQTESNP